MNPQILTENVASVAEEVGGFIRSEASNFNRERVEYKGLNDLVSYVDKTAEQQLVAQLSKLLPEAGFITEEKTVQKKGEKYNWIIDPLDGTTNFIHGIPTFAISVALEKNGQVIVGVVYEINRDEVFYAWQGGGAFFNGRKIQVSPSESLDSTLLATGFPYHDFTKQTQYLNVLNELMQSCHGLRRIGSAAVDLAYVAAGRFDGFFEYNLNAWDVAAGGLIVKEAGGKVVDFSGGEDFISKRELIAGNPLIVQKLLDVIQKYFN